MIYNNCHYFVLFVIIHAWLRLVEVSKGKNLFICILFMLDIALYRLCFYNIFTFTACFFYVSFSNIFPQFITSHIQLNAILY